MTLCPQPSLVSIVFDFIIIVVVELVQLEREIVEEIVADALETDIVTAQRAEGGVDRREPGSDREKPDFPSL